MRDTCRVSRSAAFSCRRTDRTISSTGSIARISGLSSSRRSAPPTIARAMSSGCISTMMAAWTRADRCRGDACGDYGIPYPHRRFARLWLPRDYEDATLTANLQFALPEGDTLEEGSSATIAKPDARRCRGPA